MNDWKRASLFHTKCTIEGRVCEAFIDKGSEENVISQEAVDKLGLAVEKHPQPYSLQWFQKGKAVRVDSRCLLSFSIGKLKSQLAPVTLLVALKTVLKLKRAK